MTEKQNIFERRPALTLTLLLLFIFSLLDFIAGRIFIRDNFQSFREQHFYYHHGLRPNQESYARWSVSIYSFNTNSLGFRDSYPRKISLDKKQRRILFLGDSHTEGVDLPFESTFPGILATRACQHQTEILSAAAVSYSPKIHYLIAEYFIEKKKLECDEIYVFIDISDIQNELVYEKYYPHKYNIFNRLIYSTKNYLSRNSYIFHSIKKIITERGKKEFYGRIAPNVSGENNIAETFSADLYYSFFTHFDDNVLLANPRFHGVGDWMYLEDFRELAYKGIKLGQDNILKLKKICDVHGIRLTIAVHPWHPQIRKRIAEDEYVKSWKQFALKNNIRFINLFPLFINEENPEAVIKYNYIRNDNHWNENGHLKVADELENYILPD